MDQERPSSNSSREGAGGAQPSNRGSRNRGRGSRSQGQARDGTARAEQAKKDRIGKLNRATGYRGYGDKNGIVAEPICFADELRKLIQQPKRDDAVESAQNEPDLCDVCNHEMPYVGVGKCRHRMCWVCCIRIRVLGKQHECPFCKTDLDLCVLTKREDVGVSISGEDSEVFADSTIQAAVKKLLDYRCWFPGCRDSPNPFDTEEELFKHLKQEHNRVICPVCAEHKKGTSFLIEARLLSSKDIPRHIREGEKDVPSHPWCKMCKINLYDDEALRIHYRKEHFFCRLCEADDHIAYFDTYMGMYKHFQDQHYPCPDIDNCVDVVFRSPTQLALHMVKKHPDKESEFNVKGNKKWVKINVFDEGAMGQLVDNRRTDNRRTDNRRTDSRSSQSRADASSSRRDQKGTNISQSTRSEPDRAADRWPLPLVAEAVNIQEALEGAGGGRLSPPIKDKDKNTLCLQAMMDLLGKEAVDEAKGDSTSLPADEFLGKLACTAYKAEQRLLSEGDGKEPASWKRWRNKDYSVEQIVSRVPKRVSLSATAEMMLYLVHAVPVQQKKAVFTDVIRKVGLVSHIATERIKSAPTSLTASITLQPVSRSPTPGSPTVRGTPAAVLAEDTTLLLGPHIDCMEALEWAVSQYISGVQWSNVESEEEPLDERPRGGEGLRPCPKKLPLDTLQRIHTQYIMSDLRTLCRAVPDLADFIPTVSLETIIALVPAYANIVHSNETAFDTKSAGLVENFDVICKAKTEWGKRCDAAFSSLGQAQLKLLRTYLAESRRTMKTMDQVPADVRWDEAYQYVKRTDDDFPTLAPTSPPVPSNPRIAGRNFSGAGVWSRNKTAAEEFPEIGAGQAESTTPPRWDVGRGNTLARSVTTSSSSSQSQRKKKGRPLADFITRG